MLGLIQTDLSFFCALQKRHGSTGDTLFLDVYLKKASGFWTKLKGLEARAEKQAKKL